MERKTVLIPSGKREGENWAKSPESSTANEERDKTGCAISTHPHVIYSHLSEKHFKEELAVQTS